MYVQATNNQETFFKTVISTALNFFSMPSQPLTRSSSLLLHHTACTSSRPHQKLSKEGKNTRTGGPRICLLFDHPSISPGEISSGPGSCHINPSCQQGFLASAGSPSRCRNSACHSPLGAQVSTSVLFILGVCLILFILSCSAQMSAALLLVSLLKLYSNY